MPITKNSIITVTDVKDNKTLARVTKVGPDKRNPRFTVVHWLSLDGNWKGISPIGLCASAADPAAPVDCTMKDWSLGKEKKGPLMREGYYFESPLLYKGKKVGVVCDEGNGGCMHVRVNWEVPIHFASDCEKWCKKVGIPLHEPVSEFYSWWYEGRPIGKDAKTYFADREAEFQKSIAAQQLVPATTSLFAKK